MEKKNSYNTRKNNSIKYSIVIPALNEEKTIGFCIQEIKKQAPCAEIIVVDGMSTDKTVEIVKELGVKIVVEKKQTISAGRNRGLQEANGDIICYVDADAIPSAHWFEQITRPFSKDAVVGVGGIALPEDGTWIETFGMGAVLEVLSPILFHLGIPLVTGQNMAFRRKEALDVGGFPTDISSGEDTCMFLRIKQKGRIVHSRSCVKVSMRRIRKWGLLKYIIFNTKNFLHLLKYKTPIPDDYEPVRKE